MKTRYAILFLLAIFIFGCPMEEINRVKNMEIAHVDPADVPDGVYEGKFPFMNRYLYHVKVTVKEGRIDGIEVVENGTGNDYAKKGKKVIERILKKQTPKVDAVSGATVTSKALMKCVERALKKNK